MLRINQIKCGIQEKEDGILKKIRNIYGIEQAEITHFEIVRQAIDARQKPQKIYQPKAGAISTEKSFKPISNAKMQIMAVTKEM